jgi:hypothetical protein
MSIWIQNFARKYKWISPANINLPREFKWLRELETPTSDVRRLGVREASVRDPDCTCGIWEATWGIQRRSV